MFYPHDYYKLKAPAYPAPRNTERTGWAVIWVHGGDEKARTNMAHKIIDVDTSVYIKDMSNKWWDSYKGQEWVYIPEFTGINDMSRGSRNNSHHQHYSDKTVFVELLGNGTGTVLTRTGKLHMGTYKFIITSEIDYVPILGDRLFEQVTSFVDLDKTLEAPTPYEYMMTYSKKYETYGTVCVLCGMHEKQHYQRYGHEFEKRITHP